METGLELLIYHTISGQSPYLSWFDKRLSVQQKITVDRRLDRLERFAHLGDYKIVAKNLIELRIFSDSGIRVYLGKVNSYQLILLVGGDKGSQKKDIRRAQQYWQDYQAQSIQELK